jgi:hypothetical protein
MVDLSIQPRRGGGGEAWGGDACIALAPTRLVGLSAVEAPCAVQSGIGASLTLREVVHGIRYPLLQGIASVSMRKTEINVKFKLCTLTSRLCSAA